MASKQKSVESAAEDHANSLDHEVFDRRTWPFYWITQVSGKYIETLEVILKRNDLDIPRWRVLVLLESGAPRSVKFLAQEAIVKLSTMTRIIQRMKEEGLVDTRPRSSDTRVTEVMLTEKGYHSKRVAQNAAMTVYKHAFDEISTTDRGHLNALLAKIFENLVSKL